MFPQIDLTQMSIIVFAQTPYFLHYDIFTFQAQIPFKQAAVRLSFFPCNLSHSKQSAFISFPLFQLTLFQEISYFY